MERRCKKILIHTGQGVKAGRVVHAVLILVSGAIL